VDTPSSKAGLKRRIEEISEELELLGSKKLALEATRARMIEQLQDMSDFESDE
jgi:hypothetical protein